MRNRVVPPRKPVFAILVDGECEFWYFQMLKRNERSIRVDLKPEIPQKKKLSEQFKKVVSYADDYDKVFWIVDLDVILSETLRTCEGKKSALTEFGEYTEKLKKKYKNVIVIINNPCLEFWILLHFEATKKFFTTCEDATRKLQKYLPDYEKCEKYFTKHNNDIYLKLKTKLQTAISNAKYVSAFEIDNPQIAICQMHFLFEHEALQQIVA